MKQHLALSWLCAFAFFVMPATAQTKTSYHIINRIQLPGDGGWDYITSDDDANLLYVSHGNMVHVVDQKTGKLTATIEDTKGVHGIAIAPPFGKGYISCGRDSTVVVFDTKTFKTLSRVKVNGSNPDAILYDPFSKAVFAFNGRSKNITVIDAKTDKIIADINVEGKLEFAASNENGKVYVNIEDKGKVCVINSATFKVESYWSTGPAEEPSGLAIDNEAHHLFSVSDGHLVVIDAQTGKIIAALPIGDRVDGVAFDKNDKRAFSANGDGTITVVAQQDGKYTVLDNVTTQKGARTIAVNSNTHHIYLPTADFGEAEKGKRAAVKAGTFVVLEIGQ